MNSKYWHRMAGTAKHVYARRYPVGESHGANMRIAHVTRPAIRPNTPSASRSLTALGGFDFLRHQHTASVTSPAARYVQIDSFSTRPHGTSPPLFVAHAQRTELIMALATIGTRMTATIDAVSGGRAALPFRRVL